MSKHTPGPWRVTPGCTVSADDNAAGEAATIEEDTGERRDFDVACCDVDECISSEETEANARLIAAAPELYEALQSLMCEVLSERDENPGARRLPSMDTAYARARAALARAEGREVERG